MFNKPYLSMVLQIVQVDRQTLYKMAFLMLTSSAMDFLGLSLIGPFVLFLVNTENQYLQFFNIEFEREKALFILGASIIFLYSLKSLISILLQWKITKFTNQELYRIRRKLMEDLISYEYSNLSRENTNDLIYDIQTLTSMFTGKVLTVGIRLFSEFVICLVIVMALAYQNIAIFSMLLLVTSIFIFLYDKLISRNLTSYGKSINSETQKLLRALSESVKGFKELRVLGKQVSFLNRFTRAASICSINAQKADILTSLPRYLVEVLMIYFIAFSCFLLFVWGYDLAKIIATMSVFSFACVRLIPSVNSISSGILKLKFGRNTTERLFERLNNSAQNKKIAPHSDHNSPVLSKFEKLSIKNVFFSYKFGNPVLKNINLEIRANQVVAIVGDSGVGKSTLVDIIMGFLSPESGEVLINSKPLKNYQAAWLDMVAYLPQETLTVDSTLRYNISLSEESNEELDRNAFLALQRVGLDEFFKSLELGLDTRLGENGSFLSGGQKQRVSIARALFHQRQILVLDEVTSALDDKSEEAIVTELEMLKKHCNIILITHRKKLLTICDNVYNLNLQ